MTLQERARWELGVWLKSFQWDSFATFTFRDASSLRPMLALDRVQSWTESDKDRSGAVRIAACFLAAEHHMLGGCHAHGLLKLSSGSSVGPFNRQMWQSFRHRYNSLCRFETPRGGAAVAYVAKYVVKQDLDWRILGTPVKVD